MNYPPLVFSEHVFSRGSYTYTRNKDRYTRPKMDVTHLPTSYQDKLEEINTLVCPVELNEEEDGIVEYNDCLYRKGKDGTTIESVDVYSLKAFYRDSVEQIKRDFKEGCRSVEELKEKTKQLWTRDFNYDSGPILVYTLDNEGQHLVITCVYTRRISARLGIEIGRPLFTVAVLDLSRLH